MKNDTKIYPGQGVRVRGVFRDPETRVPIDPGNVVVIFQRPDDTETSVVCVRVKEGHYFGRIVVNQAGFWNWRMVSEAPGEAAKEGSFEVVPSKIAA